ncbi:MAG: CHAT domain-containing protein [Acidobacteriota bacterium]
MIYLWAARMRTQWQISEPTAALRDSLEILDQIEDLRRRQPHATDRALLMSVWGEPYRRLAGYLLGSGQTPRALLEAAFEAQERMRGRSLAEALSFVSLDSIPEEAREIQQQLSAVNSDKARIQRQLRNPETPNRPELLVQLEDLESELERLKRQLSQWDPLRTPPPVSLRDVEANLAPNEALLAFQVASDFDVYGDPAGGSWLLVSTRQGTAAYRLEIAERADFDASVERLSSLLAESKSGDGAQTSLESFADKLLQDHLAGLPADVDHLIVVPDAGLHKLPFGALRPGPERAPLASRYGLSVVPSAALWLHWKGLAPPPADRKPALILADPPVAGSNRPGGRSDPSDRPLQEGVSLPPLPFARQEGEMIRQRLRAGSQLWLGEQAAEHRLKQTRLDDYTVLHFATHAILDDLRPMRSMIWLAPGADNEDGWLQPFDIASLELGGQVVVLSACKTATGQILPNEGAMSLARPFFEARARVVVGSLWNLPDQTTSELFQSFYDHLVQGASVAQALAAAQRDQIRRGYSPRTWAGVAVLGDGAFIPFPGGLENGWWTRAPYRSALWILLAAALVYGVVKGRRHFAGRRGGDLP